MTPFKDFILSKDMNKTNYFHKRFEERRQGPITANNNSKFLTAELI